MSVSEVPLKIANVICVVTFWNENTVGLSMCDFKLIVSIYSHLITSPPSITSGFLVLCYRQYLLGQGSSWKGKNTG